MTDGREKKKEKEEKKKKHSKVADTKTTWPKAR